MNSFCSQCGHKIDYGGAFCQVCGTKVPLTNNSEIISDSNHLQETKPFVVKISIIVLIIIALLGLIHNASFYVTEAQFLQKKQFPDGGRSIEDVSLAYNFIMRVFVVVVIGFIIFLIDQQKKWSRKIYIIFSLITIPLVSVCTVLELSTQNSFVTKIEDSIEYSRQDSEDLEAVSDEVATVVTCKVCGKEFKHSGYTEVANGVWEKCNYPVQSYICSKRCGEKHTGDMNNLLDKVSSNSKCTRCNAGKYDSNGYCTICGAASPSRVEESYKNLYKSCPGCNGKGYRETELCPICNSKGKYLPY